MALSYPSPTELDVHAPQLDVIRRYCPSATQETCDDLAALAIPYGTDCWPWLGLLTSSGYGYFMGEPTPYGATTTISSHRYMYEVLVGDVSMADHIHHRCLNKACWNPLHLEAVTPKEHAARHRKGKS
jgi:hypothetical protein